MPRAGLFGGFYFDPEVFAEYMAEQPTWNDRILASGVLVQDNEIMNLIGDRGNVATLPFYVPIDEEESQALNNDGETNNVPVEISGKKPDGYAHSENESMESKRFYKRINWSRPFTARWQFCSRILQAGKDKRFNVYH